MFQRFKVYLKSDEMPIYDSTVSEDKISTKRQVH